MAAVTIFLTSNTKQTQNEHDDDDDDDDNDDNDDDDDDGDNKGNADERLTKGLRLPLYSSDAAPSSSSW